MSFFVRATVVVRPASRFAFFATQVAAAMLTVVTLAQLFTFEDFPTVLSVYPLPGGYPATSLFAALLVTIEVLAVPYLLMMRLSLLMRFVSLGCGWISCLVWFALSLRLITTGNAMMNSGLFGATFAYSSAWLSLVFAVILGVGMGAAHPVLHRHVAERR